MHLRIEGFFAAEFLTPHECTISYPTDHRLSVGQPSCQSFISNLAAYGDASAGGVPTRSGAPMAPARLLLGDALKLPTTNSPAGPGVIAPLSSECSLRGPPLDRIHPGSTSCRIFPEALPYCRTSVFPGAPLRPVTEYPYVRLSTRFYSGRNPGERPRSKP